VSLGNEIGEKVMLGEDGRTILYDVLLELPDSVLDWWADLAMTSASPSWCTL